MDDLQVGDPRKLGRYELRGRLGSGGMGDVFLGEGPDGDRVAVKVIRLELARDNSFREGFARRVEAVRRVKGAVIAQVIDADLEAQPPWVATEYVEGPSLLESVSRDGPLPFASVAALASGLAEGLAELHEAGVPHGDLKPSNVLLTPGGPRIVDFGFAQADAVSPAEVAGRPITVAGRDLGTPGYASPEQELGDPAGPPSDIFSLGAVLAFAASGENPYGTGSPAGLRRRVLDLRPRLNTVPGGLRPLLGRSMTRAPEERPTAADFLAGLKAACPDKVIGPGRIPDDILPNEPQPRPGQRSGEDVAEGPRPQVGGETPPPGSAGGGAPALEDKTPSARKPQRGLIPKIAVTATISIAVAIGLTVTFSGHGSPAASGLPASASTANATAPHSPLPTAGATVSYRPLSEAVVDWKGNVKYTVTGTPQPEFGWEAKGRSWEDSWQLLPNCQKGPCSLTLRGKIDGHPFIVLLARSGVTYSGSTTVSDFWYCGSKTNDVANTLRIRVTGSSAKMSGQWTITRFSGSATWAIAPGPGGECTGGAYSMTVESM